MQRKVFCAAAAIAAICLTSSVMAQDALTGSDGGTGWSLGFGALALDRSAPDGGPFVAGNPSAIPFRSGSDLDFGVGTGAEATISYDGLALGAIEARLMYVSMDGTDSFIAPGSFIGAGFIGPGGTTFDSEFDTTLASAEINLRHSYNEHLSVLAGLRAFDIGDTQRTVLNANVATGLYEAENTLFGAQIGAEWAMMSASNPVQIVLTGKLGAYSARSNAGIREFQGNNFIGEFQSDKDTATSVAAEIGVRAEYRISKATVLTAGYHLLWADDLALASNAASESLLNPSLLRDNVYRDDLTLQGLTLGVKISF